MAFIPYGAYWSTPFAKWQGSLSRLHSLKLAANTAKQALASKGFPTEVIDLGILGITNPQVSSFYGLPWVTAMMGLEAVTGPTVQQACATSARILQMANQEITEGSADCALLIAADRCSNGAVLYYPDETAPGGRGVSEAWVLDNFGNDPFGGNAMVDTADNVARQFGISTAMQHDVVLRRSEQYAEALANDRAFQRRYMVEVPLTDANFRKQIGVLSSDEGIFATTREGLDRLKPVKPGGSVTFGGQTHPADGNAGMIVTSRDLARKLSLDSAIEVEILGFGQGRTEKAHMPKAVIPASHNALRAAGLKIAQIDAVKSHNPFAVNDIAFAMETGFPVEKMNNFGSSLIWGHPQGPTGLRAMIEMIEELVLRGGGVGLFNGCAAGDSAMAVVLRVTESRG
ncbi:thiolase family protein [Magnetospirillum sp. 15-1]|uniref:thiolase family protein n=1 Tax=Magnetospirillum sp. 15-1 TaxID=1979370 RepID=UPI000BBC95A2|nr:thiolase family protein [Magnetospirillum sp. 15-1]